MTSNRILIVDDDPDLLFLVAHGVKNLGPDYHVSTAIDGSMALKQVQKHQFDLIITDYTMPEMTGLDLVQQVRQLSPETQFILMTAHHDTSQMRSKVGGLELAGFVGKPFTLQELLKVILNVVARKNMAITAEVKAASSFSKDDIQEQLRTLHYQTGARSVLLVDADGRPEYIVGEVDRAKASRLGAFVSANFLAIVELATLFGDNDSVFKSSYHEGNNYNIYAYSINANYFLSVVFDTGGKPGAVWFYTKQVATAIAALLPDSDSRLARGSNDLVAQDFDDLFGNQ